MKRWSVFLVSLLVAATGLLLFLPETNAEVAPPSPWFNSNLVVERAPDKDPPQQTFYNVPCEDTTFRTFTPGSWGTYSNGTDTECVYKADYGFLGFHRLQLNGTETAYELHDTSGAFADIYPIAYTNSAFRLMQTNGASSVHNLYVYDDIPNNLTSNKNLLLGHPSSYQLTKSSSDEANVMRDKQGQKIGIFSETLGYSSGGRFMVSDSGYAQNLMNLQTKTVRQFGQSTYRSGGMSPNTKLIVDASGSKVIVFDNEQRTQRLYNLDDCTPAAPPDNKEKCSSIDLTPILNQAIGSGRGYSKANFISRNTLELFTGQLVDGAVKYQRYFIHPDGAEANSFEYLALGDSFASGEGAYNYKYPTDTADNRCHLSLDSYPYLIKKQLSLTTAESVACSGARMKDVWFYDNDKYNKDEKQSKGKEDPSFNNEIKDTFQVGYRSQSQFIKDYAPNVITASIGGNDIGFGYKIQKCVFRPGDCYDSPSEKTMLFKEISSQFDNLVETYKKLKLGSVNRKIYIVGYPQVATPAQDQCGANVHLSMNEIILSNHIITDLNATIKAASQRAGVRYVDVSDAFVGHRLCEAPNWDLAMNGITAGNDAVSVVGYPLGRESFHPNNFGHELYRDKILSETSNFTQDMPALDETISRASIVSTIDTGYSADSAIPTPRYSTNISKDVAQLGDKIQTNITTKGLYLNAGDSFAVELHSTPQIIGSAIADSMTSLKLEANISSDTTPGLHTIHVVVTDIEGRQTDLYREIFVVQEWDRDGDGIPDDKDPCSFVEPTNIDEDKDGTDDSCDGFISKAPVVDPDSSGDTSGGPKDPPGGDATPPVPPVFLTIKNILRSVINNIINNIKSLVKLVRHKNITIITAARRLFLKR